MTEKIARRWYCDTCQKEHHRHNWSDSCSRNQHSVRRICGYSQCSKEVGTETACCEEHKVLGYREALHFSAPPITSTSGEWLFRERLRLGLTRSQITDQLKKWGVRVSSSTLAATEVRDRPLPADWLLPLTALNFQEPDHAPVSVESEAARMAVAIEAAFAMGRSDSSDDPPSNAPPKPSPMPAQESKSSEQAQEAGNGRLRDAAASDQSGQTPDQTPQEQLLRYAVQRAQEAALCATIASTLPTPEVPLDHFVRAFFNCKAAWDLVCKLPLSTFLAAFPHPDQLVVPDPPLVENEPIASVLPKIVAYHLERETVRALAESHFPIMTGDFFAGLARIGAWAAIANFPALTFFYAMKHYGLPSQTGRDRQGTDGVPTEVVNGANSSCS